ncbi:uncharacterized protein TNCV_2703231 [Trichonephila clavipes]|nr:uncharacterized protein TNCV_2703231 [Trichonephila clavipes]
MASSTTYPQFPKPKKSKGKSPIENLKRNISSNPVIPGISYAQILNPNSKQQMAAPGNTSSASNKTENNKNEQINLEALNAAQSETGEFGFLQAILEIQKIFTLFPSLLKQLNLKFPHPNLILIGIFSRKLLQTLKIATYRTCHLNPEIESQVRELTSEILAAHTKASRPMTHSEPPYVQGELKQLFKERNRARKLWQFTKFPQHKTDLNRIQNKIKRKVGQYRQQVWEDHLTSLDAEDGSLWGTARAFRKRPPRSPPLMAPTASLSVTQIKPN